MRLSVLTTLGVTAFLGIMTADAPDANAAAGRATRGARGAVVVSPGRTGTAIVRLPHHEIVVSRTRGARGEAVVTHRARVKMKGVRALAAWSGSLALK
jgi:hypothetical protein